MSDQELLTLHGRLIAGNLHVASRIVELTLPKVVALVARKIGALHDRQDAEQAALDAMLVYLKNPAGYDPKRSQLVTFLCSIALNKALNIVRSDKRRAVRETRGAEELANARDDDLETSTIEHIERERMGSRWVGRLVKDERDQQVLSVLCEGGGVDQVRRALGLPESPEGIKEAQLCIERLRGRARRIGRASSNDEL